MKNILIALLALTVAASDDNDSDTPIQQQPASDTDTKLREIISAQVLTRNPTTNSFIPSTQDSAAWDQILLHDRRVESLDKLLNQNSIETLNIHTPDLGFGAAEPLARENLTQTHLPITSREEMRGFNQGTRELLSDRIDGYGDGIDTLDLMLFEKITNLANDNNIINVELFNYIDTGVGNDTILLTLDNSEWINTNDGDDIINASLGDDTIVHNNDLRNSELTNNTYIGGETSNDIFKGGTGNNTLNGNDINVKTLTSRKQAHQNKLIEQWFIDGNARGAGNDTINGNDGDNIVIDRRNDNLIDIKQSKNLFDEKNLITMEVQNV